MRKNICWLGIALLVMAAPAHSETPNIEEIWTIVQQQQAEIDELKRKLAAADAQLAAADQKIEATGDYLDAIAIADMQPPATSVGGYGEVHYNNLDADDSARDLDQVDFHRFVLFFGHEFSDRIRFFSELEIEHSIAGDGQPGEVELEQAYVDFALTDTLSTRAGLFLLPVGIINETHEPPSFYGVERNDVENIILPSTWWEAGASLNGHFDNGLSWDVALHSGLAMPTTGGSAFRVRSGRQKVGEAIASDPAYTARVKYTGIPGLELAASYQYQTDPSQIPGDGLDGGQLFTTHAVYEQGGFGLRGLYAAWRFDGVAVEAADADQQDGWYLEPSYRFTEKWGVYARYEDLDGARDQDKFTQNEIGFNYWPIDGVVLKMDYRQRDHSLTSSSVNDFDALDLGFGFAF